MSLEITQALGEKGRTLSPFACSMLIEDDDHCLQEKDRPLSTYSAKVELNSWTLPGCVLPENKKVEFSQMYSCYLEELHSLSTKQIDLL